ncbi:non-homologous end-joining DNA ligase [Sphingosinicella terrae]|uniref:non-homologous end-joining DNA ligase n=1 Tax=Sphingosinicella terrae TaxID=2172047 RepID=UPI0013B388F3|nr:non-homologous end-joining DNA ligase [Sphingosinicella terrae]
MSERVVEGVRLSNPDKILYPEQGITKSDLADHYLAVAEVMLPHVSMRPITMVRCPTGRQKNCFYQRHAGAGIPRQIEKVKVPGFDNPYLFIRDAAGLVALVQIGVLEIHPWSVTVEHPDRADRVIFDLDPDEGLGFADVVAAALEVRKRLDALGLASFVKTTGGKGLHVVVPIDPVHEWREVKGWAKAFSEVMAADDPARYLTRIAKAERVGRIFIDYLRNDPTSTAVGPYSTRARPGAPVALPLDWGALDADLDPGRYTVRTVAKLVSGREDPWAGMIKLRQRLPDPHAL